MRISLAVPSLASKTYFRLGSAGRLDVYRFRARPMASQAADSLDLRKYPRIALDQESPNHSTFSGTRLPIDLETHRNVLRVNIGRGIGSQSVLNKDVGVECDGPGSE